jgi:4-diphosphocytidyl-2-C-methyl-D-erythritol kinase
MGSDVPFFLEGPAAFVTGRGDILESFEPPRQWWVLLVNPGFSIDTAAAYRWLDEERKTHMEWSPDRGVKERFLLESPEHWRFTNSFYDILVNRFPELGEVCGQLEDSLLRSITGSGSTCFAFYETYETAARASAGVDQHSVCLKETLARSLLEVLQ